MGYYNKKGGVFDRFFNRRNDLIDKLEAGELSKKEFLEENYFLVMRSSLNPFLRIDSYEMGLYNYQYYNVLAKYFIMLANESRKIGRSERAAQDYFLKGQNYYNEKDKATLSILEYLNFKNVEAYFIKVNSKSLMGKLYEIHLLDYDKAIFHSKAIWLLDILKERKVFKEGIQPSKIDDYINESY